jgi:TrpR-related protein YerC/YecD
MEILTKEEKISSLYRLITQITTEEECRAFFDDLCTCKEIEKMAERVYAARLLMAGNTYSQVMSRADISSATLSRVSRCVQYGQGYSRMLKDE